MHISVLSHKVYALPPIRGALCSIMLAYIIIKYKFAIHYQFSCLYEVLQDRF